MREIATGTPSTSVTSNWCHSTTVPGLLASLIPLTFLLTIELASWLATSPSLLSVRQAGRPPRILPILPPTRPPLPTLYRYLSVS